MPPFRTIAIEPRRKSTLQPMHAIDEIWLGGFHRQVVVVSHNRVSVETPSMTLTRFVQNPLERLCSADRFKHLAAVIAAVDYMVTCPRILQSKSTCHRVHPIRSNPSIPASG